MSSGEERSRSQVKALTMGDPAGIGPELIVMAWNQLKSPAMVIGRSIYLQRAAKLLEIDTEIVTVESVDEVRNPKPNQIPCLEIGDTSLDQIPLGNVIAEGGEVAYQSVVKATELTKSGATAAVVTLPLNKAALHQAGHDYPGHTELLAELCGVEDFAMMLYVPPGKGAGGPIGLGVVHTTLHQSLRTAIDDLSVEGIHRTCRLADYFGRSLLAAKGIKRDPTIAVAALNPHGGEQGLFGNEETQIIAPAVELAVTDGIHARGPLPCDTLMPRAVAGEFDLVVAMVHDQGHIALKLLGMHQAVNVTLGLPIIRTSVAHGTAFELAGRGQADFHSLVTAFEVAEQLSLNRISPPLQQGEVDAKHRVGSDN